MELAREPGALTPPEKCQAAHTERMRGGDRLSYRRGLDKSVIRSLTQQSAWVGTHENIFVLGPMVAVCCSSDRVTNLT